MWEAGKQNFEQSYLGIHLSDSTHLWTGDRSYTALGFDGMFLHGVARGKQEIGFLEGTSTVHHGRC